LSSVVPTFDSVSAVTTSTGTAVSVAERSATRVPVTTISSIAEVWACAAPAAVSAARTASLMALLFRIGFLQSRCAHVAA
jgi:hypothetical protein